MEERDLYEPVKCTLEAMGFSVKGEVGEIDIFAMRENETIAVELKTKISLKLLYQAVEREKIADSVYIAIPLSAKKSHADSYHHFIHLLRRLEIGLLIVNNSQVTVELEALRFDRQKSVARNAKKQKKIVSEFQKRNSNLNIGGTKGKKMTHYRERVIKIGKYLMKSTVASPKEIQIATEVMDTSTILQKNYYGWFERISRGLYGLTSKGESELTIFQDQIQSESLN